MADTLAVLHSHTLGAVHDVHTGPVALSNARQGPMGLLATSEGVLMARQVGSQKAAAADAARRPVISPASQRSGSSKAASSKASAPKAGPKQACQGEPQVGPGNSLFKNRRTCIDSVCGVHMASSRRLLLWNREWEQEAAGHGTGARSAAAVPGGKGRPRQLCGQQHALARPHPRRRPERWPRACTHGPLS